MIKERVLIVENEPLIGKHLRLATLDFGYEVDLATSAATAVAAATAHVPDVVLMDIHLDGLPDGIDAAKQLRRCGIPVVFLTAFTDDATLSRAQTVNPAGYLIKPFVESSLQNALKLAILQGVDERTHRAAVATAVEQSITSARTLRVPRASRSYIDAVLERTQTSASRVQGALAQVSAVLSEHPLTGKQTGETGLILHSLDDEDSAVVAITAAILQLQKKGA